MINKNVIFLAIFLVSLFAISTVSATENVTDNFVGIDDNIEIDNLEMEDNSSFETNEIDSESNNKLSSSEDYGNLVFADYKSDILGNSPPYTAYSVSVSDTTIDYGSSGTITVNISPVSSSSYDYRYDFYLKIYDSNGNEKISNNYYSSSSTTKITHTISANQLNVGVYTIKLENYADGYVMDTATLTVKSVPSYAYSVSVSDTTIDYGSSGTITVSISPASSSYNYKYDFYLKIYDSNGDQKASSRYYSTSSSTSVSYTVRSTSLGSGIFTIKLLDTGDNTLKSSATLTIKSIPYSVSVSDTTIDYGSSGTIYMSISPASSSYNYKYDFYLKIYDSNGDQKVIKRYYSTSSSYSVSYSVSSTLLEPGIYTIKLLDAGDNSVKSSAVLKIKSVPSYAYSVDIDDMILKEGESGNIFIDISPASSGYKYKYDFYLKIYDSNDNQKVSQRYYSTSSYYGESYYIDYDKLSSGFYTIKIINNYDDNVMDSAKLFVCDKEFAIELDDYYYVNENVKVNYTISDKVSGYLNIYLNDTFIKEVGIDNPIELGYLNEGDYTVKVVYKGDWRTPTFYDELDFSVYKLPLNYYLDYDLTAGDSGVIKFIFDDITSGNINVYFPDWSEKNNFTSRIIDGEASIAVSNIIGGYSDFTLTYEGNESYESIADDYIYIEYKESPISLIIPEVSWGQIITINPTLPKGATGNMEVLFDDKSLVNISVGKNYIYNALNGGKHYLTIKYDGDNFYCENETTFEINIKRFNSTLNINSTIDANPYSTLVIILNDETEGSIKLTVNNQNYFADVINGTARITVNNMNVGSNNVIINYTGDAKYNPIYTVKNIDVVLKDPKLNLNINNIISGKNVVIKPTVASDASGTHKIYVDGILKTTLNIGNSYSLQKPSIGQHKIKIIYSGDSYFENCEKEYSFRVFTFYPIEVADTKIVFGSNKKFQAKFYDEYGLILANKYVSFMVNGSEYPVKTNSDGIAILDIDLGIGEFNVTSVSILDENTTNKLLIFHSVQAESKIIEYGSDDKFKVKFLDENAKPLSDTNIVFSVDGKETMVKTDVDGLAILNTELTIGTHYITSINTITDENMTNKVVVVSDINSIITIETSDINYNQKAIVKVNIDSAYLNADVTVKVTGENGFEQIFTQKAAKTITKELSNLNASKYCVDVKYEDSDLLVIQKNATFNVLKIDPSVTLSFEGETLTVDIFNATGNVEIKVNGAGAEETLTDGKAIKDLLNLKVGENSVEVYYKGDNNYNPLIKTDKYVLWNTVNLDVDFSPEIFSEEYVCVYVYNLAEDIENGALTLLIDDVKVSQDSSLIEDYYDGNYGLIEFDSSGLAEGTHTWKITYTDISNYINVSKSGTFDVVVPPEPDTYRFVLITNKSIIYVPFDKITWNVKKLSLYDEYAAEYYDDPYINYTFSTFTLNGVEYTIIESSINYPFASLYVSFNPNEYKQHDGIFYKVKDGEIVDAIGVSEYENYDGVMYRYVGLGQMTFAANSEEVTYVLINGECYKIIGTMGSFQSLFYKAILNTDYKMVNGKFYTLDGEIIENFLDESYDGPYAVVNGTFYDIDGNSYSPHSVWSIGYELINNNGQLDKVVYGNDLNNTYAVSDGQLCYVDDGAVGMPVKIDMTQSISEDEIIMPSLDNISGGQTVEIKLPSDAIGTVTFTVNGKDYPFDVVNGQANVVIPNLGDGDYPYTIAYSGGGKYSSFISNGSLKVKNVVDNSKIEASNANVLYTTGSYYTIKVYGKDGKLVNGVNVVIKVNGKTFKTLTTTNGVAKFKVTNVPGTYKMTINALGKSVTKTLTVKHLVTLKTATVKKSAKKLVLTATLAKVNGKYLKNKKITFKFNGKKYTAKTNKKGVAKVTVKSSVLKKLKIGKKVTYQATYLKDTVKKTVKVKK